MAAFLFTKNLTKNAPGFAGFQEGAPILNFLINMPSSSPLACAILPSNRSFTAVTGVRIPYGTPLSNKSGHRTGPHLFDVLPRRMSQA
jgi:hypothetical protein